MENNLDDILVDSSENPNQQDKSKRKILIGIASALLVAVVALVVYFVLIKKEKPQGLEVTHAELEKFVNPSYESMPKSKADEEIDQLIAEIKAKDKSADTPTQEKQQSQTMETSKEEAKNPQIQENSASLQALQKPQEQEKQPQQTQSKQSAPQAKTLEKPRSQAKTTSNPPKTQSNEKKQNASKQQPQAKSAVQTFDALKKKIPNGFYLQVGVFGGKPNAKFLEKLSRYSYEVEKMDQKGKVVNRYLVGPFKTRKEAEMKVNEVLENIAKPLIVEIR